MACRMTPRLPWHWPTSLVAFLIILAAQSGRPQTFDASRLSVPAKLDMKWLAYAGDDPSYARPEFDDSHWAVYDPYISIEALYPQRPSVIWYRLHVNVGPAAKGLALSEINISQAFEIYVNGERLIAVGQVSPWIAYTSGARVLARIPDRLSETGALVMALRVHLAPVEWHGQFPGYYASNLMLGQEQTLYRNNWLSIIGENALDWFDRLLVIGLGFVALVLFASQRRQTVYLWIFAVGALVLAELPIPIITTFRNIPVIWEIIGDLPRLASPFIWVSLYFAFVHQKVGWVWRVILIFAGILDTVSGFQQWILPLSLPLQLFTNLPFVTLLSVVVPIVLILHWRRGNREAGILLIPVILFSLYIYAEVGFDVLFQFPAWRQAALRGLNLIDRFPAGPFAVSLHNVAGILSTLTLAIIMLQRSTTMSRRQAQLESELAAAQQVQQVLVPEQTGAVPGFIVESVYLPAQQVGGDFFQILPSGDGGLLVVVGDVAGKGLPAAMLVSVLVGALRAVAEYTTRPAEILANLNERLVGRVGGGFSTALAALIAADGEVTIANAGHLSPYLDGKEVELPGALPLGVTSTATYETTESYLPAGSRLTFYSDGVVEAQNSKGELFGFERAHELSTLSAAAIVEAAKRFGQRDDITVVTIERATAIASAA
jgi:sigma-B regulation protein RsbU (phosphoserine phosphatase)